MPADWVVRIKGGASGIYGKEVVLRRRTRKQARRLLKRFGWQRVEIYRDEKTTFLNAFGMIMPRRRRHSRY